MRRRPLRALCLALAVSGVTARAGAQGAAAAPDKIALGDWLLAPTLQVRTRGEYRRDPADLGGRDFFGRLSPRVRDAWVVMERTRLGLGVERPSLRAQFTLQDARALGSPSPTARLGGARGLGRLDAYEAFAEVHGVGTRPHFIRLGRQAVVWGEGRLLGAADFAPAGRSLDAVRGHLTFGNVELEALAALLEAPSPLGAGFGDRSGPARSGVQLIGIDGKWSVDPWLRIEAYGLARIARSSGEELDGSRFAASRLSGERVTAALRVSGEGRGVQYGAEAAYQRGATSSVALVGSDIAAWAAAAHVQRTFDELAMAPTLRLRGSYASGDNGKGAYKQFDPLLADPQRFHGSMDLLAWSNLLDAAASVEIVPMADATVGVEYRYARLAQASGEWIGSYLTAVGSVFPPPSPPTIPAPTTAPSATELGHGLDVVMSYRPWTTLELRAGWSALLLGDAAKGVLAAHDRGRRNETGGIDAPALAQYAYLQATLTAP